MKKLVFTLATCCIMCACEQKTETNPFFTEFGQSMVLLILIKSR